MSQDKTYWQTKLFAKALPDKMYGQTICIGGQKNIGREKVFGYIVHQLKVPVQTTSWQTKGFIRIRVISKLVALYPNTSK